jgi:hypothetical protein
MRDGAAPTRGEPVARTHERRVATLCIDMGDRCTAAAIASTYAACAAQHPPMPHILGARTTDVPFLSVAMSPPTVQTT